MIPYQKIWVAELFDRGIDNFNEWLKDPSVIPPEPYEQMETHSYYDAFVYTPQGLSIIGVDAQGNQTFTPVYSQGTGAGTIASGERVDLPQSEEAKRVTTREGYEIKPTGNEYVAAYISAYNELPPDAQLKQSGVNPTYENKLSLAIPLFAKDFNEKFEVVQGMVFAKTPEVLASLPEEQKIGIVNVAWSELPQEAKMAAKESPKALEGWGIGERSKVLTDLIPIGDRKNNEYITRTNYNALLERPNGATLQNVVRLGGIASLNTYLATQEAKLKDFYYETEEGKKELDIVGAMRDGVKNPEINNAINSVI